MCFHNVLLKTDLHYIPLRIQRLSMEVIQQLFGNRVISRLGDIYWPSRSPDLTVRGCLKNRLKTSLVLKRLTS